jgi:uncharacterized protein
MAISPDFRAYPSSRAAQSAAVLDEGLRAYMLRVYNWMASGLVLTGVVAYAITALGFGDLFYHQVMTPRGIAIAPTGLGYLAMFSPLAFVLVLSFGVNRLAASTVQLLYWAFCVAMGASLTNIFAIYTGDSIARVFFITAAMFGGMSLLGYTTGRDLTKMGSFLMMGLFGIIIAGVVNIFLGSAGLQFVISVIGVVVFTGLVAYDTQRIKSDYVQYSYEMGSEIAAKRSVYDALGLLLNFINLFMLLLQLTGNRNSSN